MANEDFIREVETKGLTLGVDLPAEKVFEEICQDDVSDSTLRLVHEAKKLAGAKWYKKWKGG